MVPALRRALRRSTICFNLKLTSLASAHIVGTFSVEASKPGPISTGRRGPRQSQWRYRPPEMGGSTDAQNAHCAGQCRLGHPSGRLAGRCRRQTRPSRPHGPRGLSDRRQLRVLGRRGGHLRPRHHPDLPRRCRWKCSGQRSAGLPRYVDKRRDGCLDPLRPCGARRPSILGRRPNGGLGPRDRLGLVRRDRCWRLAARTGHLHRQRDDVRAIRRRGQPGRRDRLMAVVDVCAALAPVAGARSIGR